MSLKHLLTEHGVHFAKGGEHRHVREGWLGLDCPWCGESGRYHLGVHLGSLSASCWRCGRRDLAEALALILRIPPGRAIGLVKQLPKRSRTAHRALRGGKLRTPSGIGPLGESHRAFLRGRGLDPQEGERLWGLRGIGLASRLPWRIWAPVRLDGEVVSWTTRSIGDAPSRWIHASPEEESRPIKSLLYGWDHVRGTAIVVEGASDAWRIGSGAVASFGTAVTSSQVRLLASVPRRVICFDTEPEAQRAAKALAEQLQSFPGETSVVELDSSDPGEATDEEVAFLRSFLE